MELDLIVKDEGDLRANLAVQAREHRQAERKNYGDTACPIAAKGGDGRTYRREATQRLRAVVAEIYSASRVNTAAKRHSILGFLLGLALDLTGQDDEGKP